MQTHEVKKVLLVGPPKYYDPDRKLTGKFRTWAEELPPLGSAVVARFLHNAGLSVHFETMVPGKENHLLPYIGEADAVAISTSHIGVDSARKIVDAANHQSKPNIVGGVGPTFSQELFADASAVVVGEAESILAQVVDDLRGNRLQHVYDTQGEPWDIHGSYVVPDRSIFRKFYSQLNPYRFGTQEWARGCNNSCSFCTIASLQGSLRYREANDIIQEIEGMNLRRGSYLFAIDSNVSHIPKDVLTEVFTYLSQKGIRWFTEGTVKELLDDHQTGGNLLEQMSAVKSESQGGCYSICYGADDLGHDPKKGGNRAKEISLLDEAIPVFHRMGIPLHISVIVGLDHHTYPDSFFWTREVLEQTNPHHVFFHIATPYPGTAWGDHVRGIARHERGFGENRMLPDVPSSHFSHRQVVFQPLKMTPEELYQGWAWLIRQQYSPSQVQETTRQFFNKEIFQTNPLLGTILTGFPWGMENMLALRELSMRGKIDWKMQHELDSAYRDWKSRSHH